jgi:hypothetical protein
MNRLKGGLSMRSAWLAVFVFCSPLISPVAASAQQLTGSVEGIVRDSSGGVVPGASVQLSNTATGIVQTQTTGPAGAYLFSTVQPGAYRLTVELTGFKKASQDFDVELNKTVKADIILAVGETSEEVVVTGSAAAMDVRHTDISTNVDAKTLVDLPTINRDITTLVEMVPGVRQVQGVTAGGSQVIDLSGNYALGGATRRSQSVFYVDGSENMGAWRLQALQMPNPDTIQEVQIIASTASAEFGKEPGISMNAIIKSGTNQMHGTAFYAGHITSLNANTWSANQAGSPRPTDQQKWTGGTAGGPIQRNRTFFFASFQHFYDNDPSQQSGVRMPTAAMLKGDFNGVPNFSINAIDPGTGLPIGRIIPANLINPIAAKLAERIATIPEYSNDPVRGRFFWAFTRPAHSNEVLGKIDHQFNERHQISGSYMTTGGNKVYPDGVSGLTNNIPGWGGNTETGARQHTASARHVWTAGRSLVVENRFAIGRLHSTRDRTAEPENLATLGGVWPEVAPDIAKTLPSLFLSGGPSARGGQFSDIVQQNIRALNTTSWTKAGHNFKFGAEVQRSNYSRQLPYENGQISFTGSYSATSAPITGPWPTLVVPSGDTQFAYAWADFLMGKLRTFQATGPTDNAFRGMAAFFFAQDQFRVGKAISVTAGLRYELYGTQTSKTMLAGYVPNHVSDQYPNAPVGLAFEGDKGIPRGMRTSPKLNFAPRLGVAWDVFGNGRTVVRAGGGLYYAYPPLSIVEQLASTVAAPTIVGNNAGLSDPWGTARLNSGDTTCQFANCAIASFSSDPSKRTWPAQAVIGFDPNVATPYQWQFNAAVERHLGPASIEASYVGNRARKGWSVRDNNLAVWRADANTGNVDARRPDQRWLGINLISTDSNEVYDAFQLVGSMNRRSLFLRLTYSLQRSLSTGNAEGQEVGIDNAATAWASNPRNIAGDMASVVPRQQIRGFISYELPRFDSNRWLKDTIGGWQASGNFTWHDGDRLNVTLGSDWNFDGFGGDRPDKVGPISYVQQQGDFPIQWIDKSAFANPDRPSASSPYLFGSLPRNAVHGPPQFFAGGALMKNFPFRDGFRFQLRADASNVFNHPNWSNPNVNLSSALFGTIQTKTGGGRVLQLQAKLYF